MGITEHVIAVRPVYDGMPAAAGLSSGSLRASFVSQRRAVVLTSVVHLRSKSAKGIEIAMDTMSVATPAASRDSVESPTRKSNPHPMDASTGT